MNETPHIILVPTDFSETSAHALRFASAIAARTAAHLFVVHVEDEGEFDLAHHVETNVAEDVPYDLLEIPGTPVSGILTQACESGADLIVMGTHGRTGVSRLLLGSVTEAVMKVARVPVIAVNEHATAVGHIGRILCPVSYTVACREALLAAVRLATNPRVPIVLLRSIEDENVSTADELQRMHAWLPPDLVDRCELKIVPGHASARDFITFARITHADLIAVDATSAFATPLVRESGCPVLTMTGDAAWGEIETRVEIAAVVY